jgi:hypothetical protein
LLPQPKASSTVSWSPSHDAFAFGAAVCPFVQAMRRAVNTTCQGSAADIVKGAMVMLAAQLRSTGLGRHCRMLLQVRCTLDAPLLSCHSTAPYAHASVIVLLHAASLAQYVLTTAS